jgi:hypothetical protein
MKRQLTKRQEAHALACRFMKMLRKHGLDFNLVETKEALRITYFCGEVIINIGGNNDKSN